MITLLCMSYELKIYISFYPRLQILIFMKMPWYFNYYYYILDALKTRVRLVSGLASAQSAQIRPTTVLLNISQPPSMMAGHPTKYNQFPRKYFLSANHNLTSFTAPKSRKNINFATTATFTASNWHSELNKLKSVEKRGTQINLGYSFKRNQLE